MQEYKIEIDVGNITPEKKIVATTGENTASTVTTTTGKVFATAVVLKNYVSKFTNIGINQVNLQTGSSDLQSKINLAMTGVNMSLDLVQNIAGGMVAGQLLGSALAGAGVGALITVANVAINIASNSATINTNTRIENQALDISRTRAGLQFNSSRN